MAIALLVEQWDSREMQGDTGRCMEVQGDAGRCREVPTWSSSLARRWERRSSLAEACVSAGDITGGRAGRILAAVMGGRKTGCCFSAGGSFLRAAYLQRVTKGRLRVSTGW